MKPFQLTLISLAALVFARPPVFATANARGEELPAAAGLSPEIQAILDQQSAQIAELQRQLAERSAPTVEETSGALALLCRGASVDLADVRWRVQAGLDPEQAVQAVLAQRLSDQRKAVSEKSADNKK